MPMQIPQSQLQQHKKKGICMAGPLDGIRVIDLTTIYSGPICTSILGDQGADVVKVESPTGDFMRNAQDISRNGVSGAFAMLNRNKRSIVIDLSTDDGKDILKDLVKTADVVVENYRPGVMERLGIGYDVLSTLNSRLVFASINGVGHDGPYAGRRVYDAIIQAISGIATLQADPRQGRPEMVNSLICDKLTAMAAAQAISSALVSRERTGEGQRVDVAMLEAALFFLWPDNMLNYTFVGDDVAYVEPGTHANMVRQTKDGYICTMPVQMDEWLGLLTAVDLPNLLEDPTYRTATGIDMVRLRDAIDQSFCRFTTAELEVSLEANQVPFARINPRDEVLDDPQIKALGSLWEFEHDFGGPMRQARPPARFEKTPADLFRCSPEHGQHTAEVLHEFGLSDDQINELRRRNIVQ
jgi:crotonobetainyl-CoA:carnitine CoA-transferase CaiB-like acyl-CoA transferase